jgi:hypothetical protein
VRYRASGELAWGWRKLSRSVFVHSFHDHRLELSDHNAAGHPYFVADGVVTMDSLWRGDESVVQGKHVLTMFSAPANHQNVDRRKSCAMENQWRDTHRRKVGTSYRSGNMLISIPVAPM